MSKRMLIDATHPEETRVVVLNGTRLEEFDFESSTKKQIKGNIYLAKVTRVEPSLQAAFVEYGGNRHGFLAFAEIHPDYYQIPVSDREAMMAREAHLADDDEGHDHGHDHEPAPQAFRSDDGAESGDEASFGGSNDVAYDDHGGTEEHGAGDASFDDGGSADRAQPTAEGLASESVFAPSQDMVVTDDFAAPGNHEPGTAEEEDGVFVERSEAASAVETIGGDEMEEVTTRRQRTPYRHYKIQEVIKRRQILLIQVTKEERGNKGAALTTYLSLAGRYCVLMPNAGRGGGVSRKITSAADRRRLKELMEELSVPDGMGVIVRTAGSERSKAEIHRDYEYLLRLWDDIRELTLRSSAPALIYEEGSLIKRAIRDLYSRDIEEVLIEGEDGYRNAKDFMRMLMPSHSSRVKSYRDPVIPLFHRFQIDQQIDQIHSPTVQLRSGGYIVINPTEALVAIDVNSGRSTRERNIEETATKTNLEAADEVARQLRLRDLAGLIVIDFIDMEEARNRGAVERRLKDAMKNDRARIQLGRVSPFGLLELSRQRMRPSLIEASTQICPHCSGTGTIRSTESTALVVMRALEEEGIRRRTAEIVIWVPTPIALYILNQKREGLRQIEQRYGFSVVIQQDDALIPPAYRLDRVRAFTPAELQALPVPSIAPAPVEDEPEDMELADQESAAETDEAVAAPPTAESSGPGSRRRRRRRRGRGQVGREGANTDAADNTATDEAGEEFAEGDEAAPEDIAAEAPAGAESAPGAAPKGESRRRRRGRRGGRRPAREPNASGEFSPFGPAEDFARDGDPVFDSEEESESGLVETLAVETAETVTVEAVPEIQPKPRTSRRRKPAAGEATETVEPAESLAETASAKPRRSRRKPVAEAVPELPAAEPAIATNFGTPAAEEPVAVVDPAAPSPEPAAPEPVQGWPEDSAPAAPSPQVIIVGEQPAAEPSRKGWWRRLL